MKRTSLVALLILLITSSGCALHQAKGPAFSTAETPQPGQALIYIYRPPTEDFGYQRIYYIQANGVRLKDLKHGGYYPYETNPGHIQLVSTFKLAFLGGLDLAIERSTVEAAKLEFDAKAGGVYYVKLHPESHATYIQPKLFLMSNDDGESEIKVCKLATE
jgi:hypothetical protein